MNTKYVKCTSKNQISIPKEIAKKIGVKPGTLLKIDVVGDHLEITVGSGKSLTTDDLIKRWQRKYSGKFKKTSDDQINKIIQEGYANKANRKR